MFLVFSNFNFWLWHHEADNTFTGFRAPVALLNITPQLFPIGLKHLSANYHSNKSSICLNYAESSTASSEDEASNEENHTISIIENYIFSIQIENKRVCTGIAYPWGHYMIMTTALCGMEIKKTYIISRETFQRSSLCWRSFRCRRKMYFSL